MLGIFSCFKDVTVAFRNDGNMLDLGAVFFGLHNTVKICIEMCVSDGTNIL